MSLSKTKRAMLERWEWKDEECGRVLLKIANGGFVDGVKFRGVNRQRLWNFSTCRLGRSRYTLIGMMGDEVIGRRDDIYSPVISLGELCERNTQKTVSDCEGEFGAPMSPCNVIFSHCKCLTIYVVHNSIYEVIFLFYGDSCAYWLDRINIKYVINGRIDFGISCRHMALHSEISSKYTHQK